MLAGGSGVPPRPDAYQFEPKLDGQRILVTVEPAGVTVTNRRGGEITSYPELAGLAGALASHAAVLDGEVVTFNEKGQTSFQRLQRRMHVAQPSDELLAEVPAVFVAFDILWLDDEWLIGCPQHKRTRILAALDLTGPAWQTAPILDATPAELVAACRQLGLEGFMAKRLDAPYEPGKRSPAWSKIKCGRRREFVVGGWSTGQGSRQTSIGSLALGCYDRAPDEAVGRGRPPRLFYVGQAGSGLTEDMIRQLTRLFAQITISETPFVNPPKLALRFVQPLLVVEIAYTEVTEAGTLRQPSVKGIRTDVIADEVTWDEEIANRFGEPV
jgi:bifunctional non-homologous end joining protein LigD